MSSRETLVDSPVRLARESLHLTIGDASDQADVHWQLWYLTECGCYETISEKILGFFYSRAISRDLERDYRTFRMERQRTFAQNHPDALLNTLPSVSMGKSPIELLWEKAGLSRTAFAKALCIQPANLYRLEKAQCKEIPYQVKIALLNAGVSEDILEELSVRQEDFYLGFQ